MNSTVLYVICALPPAISLILIFVKDGIQSWKKRTNVLSLANILFFFSPLIYFKIATYGMAESYEKTKYGAIFWLYPMVYMISLGMAILIIIFKIQSRKENKKNK